MNYPKGYISALQSAIADAYYYVQGSQWLRISSEMGDLGFICYDDEEDSPHEEIYITYEEINLDTDAFFTLKKIDLAHFYRDSELPTFGFR